MFLSGLFTLRYPPLIPCPCGQGHIRISPVPELPLREHALVSDPGGDLHARHIAYKSTAFRRNSARRLSLRYAALILPDHNYTFFGAQYRACNLAPSSFGLPLPVLPVDFANELLAKLCSCGTSADHATQRRSKLRNEIYCLIHSPQCQGKPCRKVHSYSLCAVTHWVTISNFIHR